MVLEDNNSEGEYSEEDCGERGKEENNYHIKRVERMERQLRTKMKTLQLKTKKRPVRGLALKTLLRVK